MNSVVEDMKTKMVSSASALGVYEATSGWAVYTEVEPDSPDNTITISATVSPPPMRCMDRTNKNLEDEMFSVRVRGEYNEAYTKAREVSAAIIAMGAFTIVVAGDLDVRYKGVFRQSNWFPLEQDAKKRWVLVANYRAIRKEIPGT